MVAGDGWVATVYLSVVCHTVADMSTTNDRANLLAPLDVSLNDDDRDRLEALLLDYQNITRRVRAATGKLRDKMRAQDGHLVNVGRALLRGRCTAEMLHVGAGLALEAERAKVEAEAIARVHGEAEEAYARELHRHLSSSPEVALTDIGRRT